VKLAVTGSSGHLGEALVRVLRGDGHVVTGIDLMSSPFTTHAGSIADRAFVRGALAGVESVIHTATLHKPHVASHAKQEFVDTNVTGTLVLLEEAVAAGAASFVFTSTTSAFGHANAAPPGAPAAWITEDVVDVPKNIYGVTKHAAEDVCELVHHEHGLPVVILRTSRFFPELDDRDDVRAEFADANLKANEYLHRRVDVEDIVHAHVLAIARACELGFARYIITATTPFTRDELPELGRDAASVVRRHYRDVDAVYARLGWRLFPRIDRVYVNARARAELGWTPRYDFRRVLDLVAAGEDPRSSLARTIGAKGYHAEATGVYTTR